MKSDDEQNDTNNWNDLNKFIASYADDLGYITNLLNIYESHPFAPVGIYYHGFILRICVISVIGNIETILGNWSDKSIEQFKNNGQININNIPHKKKDKDKYYEDYLENNDFFYKKLFVGGQVDQINQNIENILRLSKLDLKEQSILRKDLEYYFSLKNFRNAIIHHDMDQQKASILKMFNFDNDIFANNDSKYIVNEIINTNNRLVKFLNQFYIKKLYGDDFYKKFGIELLEYNNQIQFKNYLNMAYKSYTAKKNFIFPSNVNDLNYKLPVVYYKKDILKFFMNAMSRIFKDLQSTENPTEKQISTALYILEQYTNLLFPNMTDKCLILVFKRIQTVINLYQKGEDWQSSTLEYDLSHGLIQQSIKIDNFIKNVHDKIGNVLFSRLVSLLLHNPSSNNGYLKMKYRILAIIWYYYQEYEKIGDNPENINRIISGLMSDRLR